MPSPLPSSPEYVRCLTLWQLADASRQLLHADGPSMQREALQGIHDEHTRLALQETSRLAQKRFGTALGQLSSFRVGEELWHLVVDFLRPTLVEGSQCVAVSGLTPQGRRALVLLGHDALVAVESSSARVLNIAAWRGLRR